MSGSGEAAPDEVLVGSPTEWRQWLAEHGSNAPSAWLVVRRPTADPGMSGITHAEAVEEGLCFGWIDSTAVRRDAGTNRQRFSPRRRGSTWSAPNRELAERLIRTGRMRPEGQAVIDVAKARGTWDLLAEAQAGVVPDDLAVALRADPAADEHFAAFSRSSRRVILEWIARARRPETRQRRIERTVELAARGLRANHPSEAA